MKCEYCEYKNNSLGMMISHLMLEHGVDGKKAISKYVIIDDAMDGVRPI